MESWENFDEALLREVDEETKLKISLERAVGIAEVDLSASKVVYLILEARLISGEVRLSWEHDDYVWVFRREIPTMDLVEQFRSFAKAYSQTK